MENQSAENGLDNQSNNGDQINMEQTTKMLA
jgi:hypothetical protein